MELSTNRNRLRAHSLDDEDNLSANSRNSYGYYNSYNSAFNSDTEYNGAVSVRDMIKLYNNQLQKDETNLSNQKIKNKTSAAKRQSQHLLAATKSSYCGLNKYSSQSDVKHFVDQLEDKSPPPNSNCCRKCANCECGQRRSRTNLINNNTMSSSQQQQHHTNIENNHCNPNNAKDILVVKNLQPMNISTLRNKPTIINGATSTEFKDDLNKKQSSQILVGKNQQQQHHQHQHHHRLLSTDSVEEANICQPIETSYQSKTTIAKTASGVRIIIDIFFDQEQSVNATDVVGSRVETDIPQSRILTEFQQQAMAASVMDSTTAIAASASLNNDRQP